MMAFVCALTAWAKTSAGIMGRCSFKVSKQLLEVEFLPGLGWVLNQKFSQDVNGEPWTIFARQALSGCLPKLI